MAFQIQVNGTLHQVQVEGDTPLLWVLRDSLGLTGSKYGCGKGLCGACTVHLDGKAQRSCLTPVASVGNAKVTTIEGLGTKHAHPLQKAWIAHQVPQCGYCQSGMLMAAAALLREKPKLTEADVAQSITNLCRCGTYNRIRQAIVQVNAEGGV